MTRNGRTGWPGGESILSDINKTRSFKKHWRMAHLKLTALALAVIAIATLSSLRSIVAFAESSAEVREEFHQTYPLSATGRVSLSNVRGEIRITTWDRNEVKVDAVKRASERNLLTQTEI